MSLSHNPEIACETLHGIANSKSMPDVIAGPSRRAFNHGHAAHCEVEHGGTGGRLLRAEATSTRQIYPWGAMRQGRLTVEGRIRPQTSLASTSQCSECFLCARTGKFGVPGWEDRGPSFHPGASQNVASEEWTCSVMCGRISDGSRGRARRKVSGQAGAEKQWGHPERDGRNEPIGPGALSRCRHRIARCEDTGPHVCFVIIYSFISINTLSLSASA